jgi:hypothetical protein
VQTHRALLVAFFVVFIAVGFLAPARPVEIPDRPPRHPHRRNTWVRRGFVGNPAAAHDRAVGDGEAGVIGPVIEDFFP